MGPGFAAKERTPDPQRLLRGYERAGLTLNFTRGLIDGGFADLHHPEYWELGFVRNSPHAAEYMRMVASIGDSLRFMKALTSERLGEINRVDFFASHEGLLLWYEQGQTRRVPRRTGWYNLSTHFHDREPDAGAGSGARGVFSGDRQSNRGEDQWEHLDGTNCWR